jgi:hypothetical protein
MNERRISGIHHDRRRTLDTQQIEATISKLNAETAKLIAEGAKIQRENRWMPAVYAIAFISAVAAFSKLFVH